MNSINTFDGRSRGPLLERVQLSCAFRTPTLRRGAALAVELRALAAYVPRIRSTRGPLSERHGWIVMIATHPIPLTVTVLRRWEEDMFAIERRWGGCTFLGWTTYASTNSWLGGRSTSAPGCAPEAPEATSLSNGQPSQRQLVVASLLRQPAGEYRHGEQSRAARH